MVRDIIAGVNSSFVSALTVKGSELFFHMGSGASVGLWKTNGTSAGTVAVKTGIYPYGAMINAGGILYFGASVTGSGVELYKSDGTTAGTGLLKEIYPGTESSYPESYVFTNNTLFFVARQESFNDREVWKSDGTPVGTVIVKNLQPIFGGGSSPYELTACNNKLFFTPSQPGDASGSEPWISDGSNAGTFRLKDINNYTQYSTNEQNSLLVGNELFFPANTIYGNRICKTDGTDAGTVVLSTPDPLSPDYTARVQYQTPLVHANGKLFFLASRQGSFSDTEIFTSDGTPSGTSLLKDIDNNEYGSSQPAYLTRVGSFVYFAATTAATGRELWKSDGTAAGTVLVKDIYGGNSNSSPANLIEMNGVLYFAANGNDGAGTELWKSDGTAAGTVRVKDIYTGTTGGFPRNMVVMGGRLYFVASTAANGSELWTSDGTEAGTYEVKDIYAGGQSSDPTELTEWNDKIVFSAFTDIYGREVWMSDGTNAGTQLLFDVYPGSVYSNPTKFVAGTDKFYFVAQNGINGKELWVSNGTSAGTFLTKDIRTGPNDASIDKMVFVDGTLFFSAFDGMSGTELWRSSGTPGTTNQVVDFWPGAQGGIGIIAKLPSQLMVGFNSAEYSYEPWVALLQGVLPVHILQFDGHLQQRDAKLFWKTTNEYNLAYYEIQRSKDASQFTAIGSQSPMNTAGTHQYHFTDHRIAERETGIVYYRLKQVDVDGAVYYSKIVPIMINSKTNTSLLFPNPAHDKTQLLLKGEQGDIYHARLVDMNGKTLQKWQFKMQSSNQLYDLDLAKVSPGTYSVELVSTQKVENIILIKY
jgi:ELWxxDGT repeat protein